MATTATREILSGSTGLTGQPVVITASGTDGSEITGTVVHTATNSSNQRDEVYLYAQNQTGVSGTVVVQWGGTDPNQHDISVGLDGLQGPIQLIPGFPAASGMVIRAYGNFDMVTVTGLRVDGWVNRVTQ